jgi:hypothetical protein
MQLHHSQLCNTIPSGRHMAVLLMAHSSALAKSDWYSAGGWCGLFCTLWLLCTHGEAASATTMDVMVWWLAQPNHTFSPQFYWPTRGYCDDLCLCLCIGSKCIVEGNISWDVWCDRVWRILPIVCFVHKAAQLVACTHKPLPTATAAGFSEDMVCSHSHQSLARPSLGNIPSAGANNFKQL